jgi:Flp pilus assembly protein TadD
MKRRLLVLAVVCAVALGIREWQTRVLAAQPERTSVTFSHDVAPILYSNCAQCHRRGGAGPFPLLTYEDAKSRAHQIATVTAKRFMPPWLPDRDVHFVEERGLTDAQIATLQRWAEQNAPEGDRSQAPDPPQFPGGWQLGKPDVVLQAPAGYSLRAEGADVYHNFIFQVPTVATRYVRAIEIHPGNAKVVHHCNMLIDRTQSSRRRDGKEGVPGFDGMDVELESNTFEPDSHFIYWKPGSVPYFEPDEMTWELDPDTDLVLNMHLRPSGKAEPVRPEIGIYFSPHPPAVRPMLMQLDRDDGLDIPPGNPDFQLDDDFKLPIDVKVLAIYPHAHYLGHDLNAYATLPDGTTRSLIRIRDWDPAWQGVFRYRDAIDLPRGTVISMRYSYDNSENNPRNPHSPPRRVTAGNQSTDEMCHLWLQVVPKTSDGSDRRVVLQEALMRHKLARFPGDYAANYNLGSLLLFRGDPSGSLTFFEQSVQARPQSASGLNGLAAALVASGQIDRATEVLRRGIAADPNSVDTHYNLANALEAGDNLTESASEFEWVLRHRPTDAESEARLGSVLAQMNDYAKAEIHLRRALSLNPHNKLAAQTLELLDQMKTKP